MSGGAHVGGSCVVRAPSRTLTLDRHYAALIPRSDRRTIGDAARKGGAVLSEDKGITLVRRFEEDWRPFWTRVAKLDAEGLRKIPTGSTWPTWLILAHCARWEDWNHDTISTHLSDGSTPSMAGFDQWNEEWAREDRDMTPEDARRWLGEAHERLRLLLDGIRAEQWDDLVSRCIEACTFHHYGEHIGDLPV